MVHSQGSQWQASSILVGDIRADEVRQGLAAETEEEEDEDTSTADLNQGNSVLTSIIEQIMTNFRFVLCFLYSVAALRRHTD